MAADNRGGKKTTCRWCRAHVTNIAKHLRRRRCLAQHIRRSKGEKTAKGGLARLLWSRTPHPRAPERATQTVR